MNRKRGDRWGCPYHWCRSWILLTGPDISVIRKHQYEGRTCPGSGYAINKPAMEQERLMAEREKERQRA